MFRLPTITLYTLLLIPLATVTGLVDASTAQATTLYVDANCGDDAKAGTSPNCADADGPKLSIQSAINSAIDTDEIEVAPGTYNEVIDFLGKAITLRSTNPSDPAVVAATIIDGTGLGNSVVKCVSGEGADTALNGFTITGGDGSACPAPLDGDTCGGGMYNLGSSPTVADCTFSNNSRVQYGGGMYNYGHSSPTVSKCTFSQNKASREGGGMYNYSSSPTVNDCTFSGNTGGNGGGMSNWNDSSPVVTACTFSGNTASIWGGGILNYDNCSPTMADCTFSENTANDGAGMCNIWSTLTVTNCTFSDNRSDWHGGGMLNSSSDLVLTGCMFSENDSRYGGGLVNKGTNNLNVTGCTFRGNESTYGGGLYIFDSNAATVTACTFSANSATYGGGMLSDGGTGLTVTNCLFTDNTARDEGGGMHNTESSSPVVADCTFTGNTADFYGGGMYNEVSSNPTVTNCTFARNSADESGGGMSNRSSSSPTVNNCTFVGNTSYFVGGGVFNDNSSPAITNCTFGGNVATDSGGGMFNMSSSSPTVANCILWGDSPDEIFNSDTGVDNPILSHSDVQTGLADGTIDGGGNIDADPLFVWNPSDGGDGWGDDPNTPEIDEGANDHVGILQLQNWSPCINKGSNAALPPDVADLDDDGDTAEPTPLDLGGMPRAVCHVDMGAYEFQTSAPVTNVTKGTSHRTIQRAINTADDDDVIEACPGTYNETIDFLGKSITLRSIDPSDSEVVAATIIDGTGLNNSVVKCVSGEGGDTVLDGFTITGGDGHTCPWGSGSRTCGGGMYNTNSSPTVTNCTFSGNTVAYGGGMFNDGSSPMVANCTFGGNAAIEGGGMHNWRSSPTVTNCMFSGNTTDGSGGGMFNGGGSSLTVTNCTFIGNTGGGMRNDHSSPKVANCTFTRSVGAGMTNRDNSSPTVASCTFSDNAGGGMYNRESSSPTVTNCTFTGNTTSYSGGGMYNISFSSPIVSNCTFSRNRATRGGGMYNSDHSEPTVTNCILWGNSDAAGYTRRSQILDIIGSLTAVSYSCVQDVVERDGDVIAGMGNIDTNPLLIDVEGPDGVTGTGDEDLGLLPRSPCIDSGDNTAAPADVLDLDGDFDTDEPIPLDLLGHERFFDDPCMPDVGSPHPFYVGLGIVDMGAIEYQGDLPGDLDGDGLEGCVDNCPLHDNPDQADCDRDGLGDYCALELGSSRDCNNNEMPDRCDIANGTSTDREGNGVPDECQSVYYVDDDAAPGQDGLAWATAFAYLQDAMAVARYGDEIRVAGGTYLPDQDVGGNVTLGDRAVAFQLITGVAIHGGYRGCPDGACDGSDPGERNIESYETVLSGDLAGDDVEVASPDELRNEPTRTENSHNIITSIGTDETAVLTGFTLTGANAYGGVLRNDYGGGMYNRYSSPTVSNCRFIGNTAKSGGGMYNYNSSPTVANCAFDQNAAEMTGGGMCNQPESNPTVTNCSFSGNTSSIDGGGMYNAISSPTVTNCAFSENSARYDGGGMRNAVSSPVVSNCTFIGNVASDDGGGLSNNGGSPTVANCKFSGNEAYSGGGIYNYDSSPIVTNCTFSDNSAARYGGAMYNYDGSRPRLTNCILWGDSPDELFNHNSYSSTVSFSAVQGGLPTGTIDGGGNTDADPQFVDADGEDDVLGTADDDLGLRACSPAVDSGDNTAVPPSLATDLDGNPRFVDVPGNADTGAGTLPIVDMGAFERQQVTPPGPVVNVTQGTFHCGIQVAIDAAVDNDEIVVSPETYNEAIDFVGKAITLRSVDPSDPEVVAATIIDGIGLNDSVVRCVSGEGPDTILDGLTITSGNGQACPAPIEDFTCGGGMYIDHSSPTVTNCTFIKNTASWYGGGMYNVSSSSPTVSRCSFTENTALSGGGMENDGSNPAVTNCAFKGNKASRKGGGMDNQRSSSPTVTNCTFSGNIALGGGALNNFDNSNPTVTNCTFTGNAATNHGGGIHNVSSSSPTVNNCVLWGDLPDEISNYDPAEDSPAVGYSDVQGGLGVGTIDAGGNIDVDPQFVRYPTDGGDGWGDDPATPGDDEGSNDDYGDLHLLGGSQCINGGDPQFVPDPDETDLDGYPRVLCGRVDMGAYEFGIGDYDCNDAVDLLDFSAWSACMTGPDDGPYGDGCEAFDFDGDDDIDMTDFSGFQRVLTVQP